MRVLKRRKLLNWLCIALSTCSPVVSTVGCTGVKKKFQFTDTWDCAPSYHQSVATRIEYPSVQSCLAPEITTSPAPHALENPADLQTQEIELNAVVQQALANSDILRTLGGSVVQSAAGSRTKFDPALTESNPATGVEAALSAFDAQVAGSLFWDDSESPNNANPFALAGGFQRRFSDNVSAGFNYEVSKITATGASFAARHVVNYSHPNFERFFRSDFSGRLEAEYRQPLMLGAGTTYNRIAGPNAGIGSYNGVLIARINTDVSLADFEAGVVSFINDVETAYWELYFAYQNLESQVAGRASSLLTWQRVKELQKVGARGGNAAEEAQARSQYYQFDAQVKDALTGPAGVYQQEQSLRYLIGMPPTDGSLLKPVTAPYEAEVIYDWQAALQQALTKRVEVRRQKWNIKRRELEVVAACLNKRPRLDFVGRYSFNGLGDNLIGDAGDPSPIDGMYKNIFGADHQSWYAGLELAYPVGFRRAGAAIANARWNLAKEQAVLKEQELRISHDLSNTARQVQRNFALVQTNFNRQASDRDRVEALQARYESGLDNINFLLQAQQSLATSQTAYYRSLVDYQLSLRDFHREKGSLLNYNQVGLSEGAWPGKAYQDANERGRFFAPRPNPQAVDVPSPVSQGGFDPTQVGNATMAYPAVPSGTVFSPGVVVQEEVPTQLLQESDVAVPEPKNLIDAVEAAEDL